MLVKTKHSLAIRINIRSHKCKQLGLLLIRRALSVYIRSSFLPKRSQFANADLVNSHYSTKYKRMFWPAIALFVNKLGAGYKRSGLVLFRLLKSLNFPNFTLFVSVNNSRLSLIDVSIQQRASLSRYLQ